MARVPLKGREGIRSFAQEPAEISYSGADIVAHVTIPLLSHPLEDSSLAGTVGYSAAGSNKRRAATLGTLQTISISTTRSVSPVRVLGRSNPIAYTRGGRTIAGTLVFATFDRDAFSDIYRPDKVESFLEADSSLLVDQLPPFNVTITASNELGGVGRQAIFGVTLVNYGTTYSIDDIYTETTYTYVAQDVTPLLPITVSRGSQYRPSYKRPSDIIRRVYHVRCGTKEDIWGELNNGYTVNDGLERDINVRWWGAVRNRGGTEGYSSYFRGLLSG